MKKVQIFIFLILITFSFSCSYLVKRFIGIKNPKVENKQSVEKYLSINDFPFRATYILKGKADTNQIINNIFKCVKNDVLLFDKLGKKYSYIGKDKCTGKQFSEFFLSDSAFFSPSVDTLNINYYLSSVEKFNYNSVNNDSTDYYLILYWSKFYKNKRTLKRDMYWIKDLQSTTNKKVQLIFINTDLQETWGLKYGEKMRIKIVINSKNDGQIVIKKIPYKSM